MTEMGNRILKQILWPFLPVLFVREHLRMASNLKLCSRKRGLCHGRELSSLLILKQATAAFEEP